MDYKSTPDIERSRALTRDAEALVQRFRQPADLRTLEELTYDALFGPDQREVAMRLQSATKTIDARKSDSRPG